MNEKTEQARHDRLVALIQEGCTSRSQYQAPQPPGIAKPQQIPLDPGKGPRFGLGR